MIHIHLRLGKIELATVTLLRLVCNNLPFVELSSRGDERGGDQITQIVA